MPKAAGDKKTIDISSVPRKPGVYIFKDPHGKVLYVGKAKNLRGRLGSYFSKGASLDDRKTSMLRAVGDFSFVATGSELEAFALEANLIKQYKPKFNVILRDDKNYPYIKLSLKEQWPALDVARRIKKDGSLYFGPYIPAGAMWETLSFIKRTFGIRPCRYRLNRPTRPCIRHQMGRCPAPCAGLIRRKDYMKEVRAAALFLKGKKTALIKNLESRMRDFSDAARYEDAARIRDKIRAVKKTWETQKVIDPELGDMDVIGLQTGEGAASFQVFFIRGGVMTGARDFRLDNTNASSRELMSGFIETFYSKEIIPPPEIITGTRPENTAAFKKWLKEKRGSAVKIIVPEEGKRLELLRMAGENARLHLAEKKELPHEAALKELRERLSLPEAPSGIGAFDVSTLSGSEPVGAFIYWRDGAFRKDSYRHMRIKTVSGVDDCAMMAETVRRTLDDIKEMPELILIDGGRGHLDAAMRAVEGLNNVRMVALAKDPDRIYAANLEKPANLEDGRPSSLLLKRIRDEVHRFAVGYHKKLRGKRLLESPLLKVRGVGNKRRLSLLKHFGSLDKIREASIEEIAKTPGMNKKAAEAVKEALNKE